MTMTRALFLALALLSWPAVSGSQVDRDFSLADWTLAVHGPATLSLPGEPWAAARSDDARAGSAAPAGASTTSMALEPLDRENNPMPVAPGARVYNARDFDNTVQRYRDYDCPDDRPLCAR